MTRVCRIPLNSFWFGAKYATLTHNAAAISPPVYASRVMGPVLWNRNYLLRYRFRFWLLKVMVPVPVPTFEKLWFRFRFLLLKKLRFRFQLHIYTIKSKFFFKNLFPFYIVCCFTWKKIINVNKFIVKCERKKC